MLVAPRPGPDCSLRFPAPGPARPAPPEQRGQLQPGPGVIAGIVLAALAAAALLAALVVWNRFCRESYYYLEESGSKAATNIATQWETEVSSHSCSHGDNAMCPQVQHRVTAEQFLAQVKSLHLEGDREFVTHFRNVTEPAPGRGKGAGQLTGAGAGAGSYEAPFYVDGYNQPKAFLATPLPLPYKFNFFWKQIWEQKVAVIVMLENIAENGKVRDKHVTHVMCHVSRAECNTNPPLCLDRV